LGGAKTDLVYFNSRGRKWGGRAKKDLERLSIGVVGQKKPEKTGGRAVFGGDCREGRNVQGGEKGPSF